MTASLPSNVLKHSCRSPGRYPNASAFREVDIPEPVKVGFERSIAVLPISALLPLKTVPEEIKQSVKFKQIARSVSEVGIIEPLVVARSEDQKGKYLLLDGHMRHAVLTDIAATEVRCLIAADDEAYTYNKRINRLATVQEHFMIVRAI